MKRLWSMKPIQNIRFEEWPKVGLCTMSLGHEIMMSSIISPFSCIFCCGVFYCGCGSQSMILLLSNQVKIMAKSAGRERRNPILDLWTPVLEFHTEHCSEVYSLLAGRDLRCLPGGRGLLCDLGREKLLGLAYCSRAGCVDATARWGLGWAGGTQMHRGG